MIKSTGKRIFGLFTAILTAAALMTAVPANAGAVSVSEEYRTWSQLDERWASVPMGNSTIKSVGCLLTSLAIMAVHTDSIDSAALKNLKINSVEEFDPGVLAKAYTARNGFSSGGGIASWGTIHTIIPQINFLADSHLKSTKRSDVCAEIKALMDKGQHIILNTNGHHWVYVEGVVDDKIYMMDPAEYGKDEVFECYGEKLNGEYWALTAKNPPSANFTAPADYEESIMINFLNMPENIVGRYGEYPDLSDGVVQITGVHPKTGPFELLPEAMDGSAENFELIYDDVDPYTPGFYTVTVSAYSENAADTGYIEVMIAPEDDEFYNSGSGDIDIVSEPFGDNTVGVLHRGEHVVIDGYKDLWGHVASKDFDGWLPLKSLDFDQEARDLVMLGDIDDDGDVDQYDLALLTDHLKGQQERPDGIDALGSWQRAAADLNGDGKLDSADVVSMLSLMLNI